MKKSICLIALFCMFALASSASGGITYFMNYVGDNEWKTLGNWYLDTPPTLSDEADLYARPVIVSEGCNAEFYNVIPEIGAGYPGYIEMTGGTFTGTLHYICWAGQESSTFHQTGGVVNDEYTILQNYGADVTTPYGSHAHIQLDGGTLNSGRILVDAAMVDGNPDIDASVDIAGGLLVLPFENAGGEFCLDYMLPEIASGRVYSSLGGVFYDIDMGENTVTFYGDVPEPSTILLLGLSGLALIRKRRA